LGISGRVEAGLPAALQTRHDDLEPDVRRCIDEAGPLLHQLTGWIAGDLLRPDGR